MEEQLKKVLKKHAGTVRSFELEKERLLEQKKEFKEQGLNEAYNMAHARLSTTTIMSDYFFDFYNDVKSLIEEEEPQFSETTSSILKELTGRDLSENTKDSDYLRYAIIELLDKIKSIKKESYEIESYLEKLTDAFSEISTMYRSI